MIVLTVLVAAIAFDYLCRLANSNAVDCARFRLYRLRDDLRELAIRGEIKPSNWVFNYLDSSLAKSIRVLPPLNLWRVLSMMVCHKPDKEQIERRWKHLTNELAKPANKKLKEIHERYAWELGRFLVSRHSTLRNLVPTASRVLRVHRYCRKLWADTKQLLTLAPETSTLAEHAPA